MGFFYTDNAQHPWKEIFIGLYVDDFVYFSSSIHEEKLFQSLLSQHIKVDFMEDVDFFLGVVFTWNQDDKDNVSILII